MENLFVSYKIALKLKELGFNVECLAYYNKYKDLYFYNVLPDNQSVSIYETCDAPLYQQVVDWFREKYKLIINIHIDEEYSIINNLKYWYAIDSYFEIQNKKILNEGVKEEDNFESYYNAADKAIEEAFKLI